MSEFVFIAKTTFYVEELGTEYVEGLTYRANPGDRVRRYLPQWLKENKVTVGGDAAQLAGTGEVHARHSPDSDPERDR